MGTSSPLLHLPAPLLPRPRRPWFPTAARPPLAFPLVVYHAKHTEHAVPEKDQTSFFNVFLLPSETLNLAADRL